jgi:cohesin loading factor subunit SCC2
MSFVTFPSEVRATQPEEIPLNLSPYALKLYNSVTISDMKCKKSNEEMKGQPVKDEEKVDVKNSTEHPIKAYAKSEAVTQQDKNQKQSRLKESFFELVNDLILSDDTEGSTSEDSKFWFPLERSGKSSISDPMLLHLDSLLKRLQPIEVTSEEENDSITRLLRILNRALGEGAFTSFQQNIDDNAVQFTDNSLKTCTVVLLIFQIFPTVHGEELLLNIIGYISMLLDSIIVPSMAGDDKVVKIDTSKVLLRGIQQRVTAVLDQLHTFLQHVEAGESIITKLEFICSKLIFAESTGIIFGNLNVESMRVVAMKLLAGMFGRYRAQQQFILDEILLSVEKLPLTRLKARQFKLKQGASIQLTTALLLLLVESSAEVPKVKSMDSSLQPSDNMVTSLESVASHCNYIVNFLFEKASKSTKTGEDPHRLLLELFMEDFLNLMYFPEWSAAELIISCFVARFIAVLESEQSSLNAQILSLESLGLIMSRLLRVAQSHSRIVVDMSTLEEKRIIEYIASFDQIYDYLAGSGSEMDQLSGNYLLCSFTSVLLYLKRSDHFNELIEKELEKDRSERHGDGRDVDSAYFELLLHRPISRYYDRILSIILGALDHSKVNLRSKALKLVSSLLDEDEDIFSVASVQMSLSNGLVDSSPLVRDAAVEVVGKYLIKHPQNDNELYLILCDRSNDTGTAVRKRVMKIFKEIYDTAPEQEVQVQILDKLLRRMDDEEESVGDLALQSLSDIVFKTAPPLTSMESKQLHRNQILLLCDLLYRVYDKSEGQANLLKKFFSKLLNPSSRNFNGKRKEIATQMVDVLSDALSEEPSTTESEKILCVLSVLATANGSLIHSSLLKFLEAYLVDDKRPINSLLGYYTLVTLRCHLETTIPTSKQRLQSLLLTRLTKFNLRELPEAVQCLWALSKDTTKKVAAALISCLKLMAPYEKQAKIAGIEQPDQKLVRLVHLIGNLSRFCSLDDHWELFQSFGARTRDVSGLIIHKLIAFCSPLQSPSMRKLALRNVGNICIGHPRHFLTEEVLQLLAQSITAGNEVEVVLKIVLDHLSNEESNANRIALLEDKKESLDVGVLHGTTKKQESDGASSAIVQSVLDSVLQISLRSEDNLALLATYLLEKILKQGYANPRVVS